jgi:MFS family permease
VGRLTASLAAFARVFANRGVRDLQVAGAGSVLGTYAYGVALPVYAYHAGGARAVGLLFFARFMFAGVAAPWLGVLADRWSRRRLMLTADALRTGIFAAMTVVATSHGPALAIYGLAVTSTVISASYPPAQAALLPSLVDSPDELTAANLVGNTISSVAMFVGPAVGGVLLALSGPAAVFALNGALFVWSIAFVLRVPGDTAPERSEHTPFLPELTAGFAAVIRRPALRVIVGLTAAQSLVEGALEVLLVVLAIRLLHAGPAGYGWLNTAMGIGSLVGAAAVAVFATRRRLAGGFAVGILCWGVPLAVAASATSLPPGLLLIGVVGAGVTVVPVYGTTLLQRAADKDVMGRVFAVLEGMIMGAMGLGALVAPGLVDLLGARAALLATGAFLPVLLVPLWPSLRRIDAESEPATEPLALLRGIAFLAELPEPVLERLAAGATAVTAASGQPVVSRGDPGHHFYVIAAGEAELELEDGQRRELAKGDSFGEIALLRDVPRTATVRAVDELRLYAVARNDFLAAVTGHAPTLEAAESVVVSRLPAGALS